MKRKETDFTNNTDIFRHKTLEERAADFGGKIELDGEFNWGIPEGNERWEFDDDSHIDPKPQP